MFLPNMSHTSYMWLVIGNIKAFTVHMYGNFYFLHRVQTELWSYGEEIN